MSKDSITSLKTHEVCSMSFETLNLVSLSIVNNAVSRNYVFNEIERLFSKTLLFTYAFHNFCCYILKENNINKRC